MFHFYSVTKIFFGLCIQFIQNLITNYYQPANFIKSYPIYCKKLAKAVGICHNRKNKKYGSMKGAYLQMELLEQRILQEGQVRPGNVLKVDCFLNHQLDVDLLDQIGAEFHRIFHSDGINKILTIEASGIAIACMTARHFDVPVVFAKKAKSKNIDGDVYTSKVHSYTYGRDYDITLAKKFLGPDDCVLILDDFLANGKAMKGLLDICKQSGCKVGGIGICIEKGFQPGGEELRTADYKLASLAIIEKMSDTGLTFRSQNR